MTASQVLKLAQVDRPDQPILIRITQKQDLDLDLLATDGDSAYRGKVRKRNLAKFKADNFDGSDAQWADILHYVLVSKHSSGIQDEQRRNLEVACSISGKQPQARLSINFRTRIEDITHRIGTIELAYSDDTDDVDLFGWTCSTINERDGFETQVHERTSENAVLQKAVETLRKELDELIQAKEDHEIQMLSKMTLLLNEKKLKIRNQQRILATAKVDPRKLEMMRLTRDGDQAIAEKSAVKTRKQGRGKIRPAPEEEEESDGFDNMDVDQPTQDRDDSEASQAGVTDTETEDEANLDAPADVSGFSQTKRAPTKASSPLPPPRALPFQERGTKNTKAKEKGKEKDKAKSADGEMGNATGSEDDEL